MYTGHLTTYTALCQTNCPEIYALNGSYICVFFVANLQSSWPLLLQLQLTICVFGNI